MLTIERRNKIKKILLEKQSITVAELSEMFDVSDETIRRDFEILQNDGFLKKTYGGAVLTKHVQSNVEYDVLANLFLDSKRRIARVAAEIIDLDDCVFIDHLTTSFQIVNEIKEKRITVMSNSIKVLDKLSTYNNIKLVATGGIFDPNLYSFMGSTAETVINKFHMDKAFISCRALDKNKGLSDKYETEADIHRAIVDNADKVYLLVDYTKFNKNTFVHTCNFDKITAIITDHVLSDDWKDYLASKGIDYLECLE